MTWTIIEGDSSNKLHDLETHSVDCIFTSPNPIRTYPDFIEILHILGEECKRVLKPEGSMWVHMEDSFNDRGSLMRWPANFTVQMVGSYDWIMRAERISHLPVGDMGFFNEGKKVDNNRLILDHCYLFHFTKKRYGYFNNFVDFNGQPCSIFTERRPLKPGTEEYEPGFPAELVKQSLLISCPDNGKILDPFSGWGTTGVVAMLMRDKQYSFIGIEIDTDRVITSKKRLAEVMSK